MRICRLLPVALLALLALSSLVARPSSLVAQGAPPAAQSPVAQRADSVLDARTRELASQLRCPVCQGLSIQDSPSELSQQMRELVRQQLADGRTPDQVKQYFVDRYGEWILMTPTAHGFNWTVYALPLGALAIGGWIVVVAFRRWTASDASDSLSPEPEGPSDLP